MNSWQLCVLFLLSSRVTQDIRGDLPKETGVGRGREAAQEAGEAGPGTGEATAKGDRTQKEGRSRGKSTAGEASGRRQNGLPQEGGGQGQRRVPADAVTVETATGREEGPAGRNHKVL